MKRAPLTITRRQTQVLRALCECGCRKVVAYKLGVTEQAVCQVLQAACRRMGVRTDMQAVLTFDRHTRGWAA